MGDIPIEEDVCMNDIEPYAIDGFQCDNSVEKGSEPTTVETWSAQKRKLPDDYEILISPKKRKIGKGKQKLMDESAVDDDDDDEEEDAMMACIEKEWYYNDTITDKFVLQPIVHYLTQDKNTLKSVVNSLFATYGLVRHQLESFDKFMDTTDGYISQIIHENSTLTVDLDDIGRRQVIEFGHLNIYKPTIKESSGFNRPVFPYECRIRSHTYACSVMVDVTQTIYDISKKKENSSDTDQTKYPICEKKIYRELLLCQIPVMVRSQHCHLYQSPYLSNEDPLDQGGYFIVNGNDKAVVAQERMKTNYPYVFSVKQPSKYSYFCEVRSITDKMRSTSTVYCYLTNTKKRSTPEVFVMVPFIKFSIPLVVIFKIIGVSSLKDMEELILSNSYKDVSYRGGEYGDYVMTNLVRQLVENDEYNMPVEELCEWIGKEGTKETTKEKRVRYVEHIMTNEFLPHIGTDNAPATLKKKTIFLSDMIYKLCRVSLKRQSEDDRDDYEGKRIDLTGHLFGVLFRPLWRTLLKNMSMYIKKNMESGKVINISDAVNSKRITSGFKYAMSTGNWGVQKGGSSTTGVAQIHNKMTLTSGYSNLRRTNTHVKKEGKMSKPRQLHISQWGFVCPIETPEGANCVAKDTKILLADGISTMPIEKFDDNKKSIDVTCVNIDEYNREEPTDIHSIFQEDPIDENKKMLLVTTITGRKIKVTDDHAFFTTRGQVCARDLVAKKDAVLIRPSLKQPESENFPIAIILDKDTFIEKYSKITTPGLAKKYAKSLKQKGYLPLNSQHEYLPILARLLGFNLTQASITSSGGSGHYPHASFCLSQKQDMEDLANDIRRLQFKPTETQRKAQQHTYIVDVHGSFVGLFYCLGGVVGKKIQQNMPKLPMWIQNGSKIIKREFLAGFQGGDGSKVYKRTDRKNGYTISIGPTLQTHVPECSKSMQTFFNAYAKLLKAFDVQVTSIKQREEKHIGEKKMKTFLNISSSRENLLNYLYNIGYRYAKSKSEQGNYIGEYLCYRAHQIENRITLENKVVEMHQNHIKSKEISQRFHISKRAIRSILHTKRDRKTLEFIISRDSYCIDEFLELTQPENGMLYVPVESIIEIEAEPVMDFTTVSDNHNFIANDFVVSNCGCVLNLASGCHVRTGFPPELITHHIYKMRSEFKDILTCTIDERKKFIAILVNGDIIGYTPEPEKVVRQLRLKKRCQGIPFDTSIIYVPSSRKILIQTDAGCFCRPVFVVENLPLFPQLFADYGHEETILWNELLSNGVIEYIDAQEQKTLRVAVFPQDLLNEKDSLKTNEPYTHLEIRPQILYSACTSLIPFHDHNQGPRNIYQTAMQKQAVASLPVNSEYRVDTISHELMYPEVPLVQTIMEEIIGATQLPMGQNVMLAIAAYTGFNQEDSIIMNQSSVDRGLFRSIIKRTYKDEEKTRGIDSNKFGKPGSDCRGLRKAVYSKVNDRGFVEPGTVVNPNDVIIAKTMNTEEITDYETNDQPASQKNVKTIQRDNSTILRTNESAVVHKVIETVNKDGCKSIKLTTRAMRAPEMGDKFSSRHGQKGTIGILYREEDMPFTAQGRVPDAIINPHAKPSRMTIGMLIDQLLGKAAVLDGEIGDGTPFSEVTVEQIAGILAKNGFQKHGKEQMYNGMTGEPIEALIFYSPCFYQKLRHFAIDKIHGRSRGPKQILTRQPVEGRSRNGGLRLGEMERDCMIAHGVAMLMQERLFEQSDAYITVVCEACGLLCEPERPKNMNVTGLYIRASQAYCRNCDTCDTVRFVAMPYVWKLLIQELMAANIDVRLVLNTSTDRVEVFAE